MQKTGKMKRITLNELRGLVNQVLNEEGISLYSNEPKTTHSFIRGDEVYKVGNPEPVGMVVSLGKSKVMVKRHDDGREVPMDPTFLYLGKDWHYYNR